MKLNEEAQLNLDTAMFLLRDALRHAERGEIGGVTWRVADAAEWLRKAADEHNLQLQGVHYPTGRGNLLTQRPVRTEG